METSLRINSGAEKRNEKDAAETAISPCSGVSLILVSHPPFGCWLPWHQFHHHPPTDSPTDWLIALHRWLRKVGTTALMRITLLCGGRKYKAASKHQGHCPMAGWRWNSTKSIFEPQFTIYLESIFERQRTEKRSDKPINSQEDIENPLHSNKWQLISLLHLTQSVRRNAVKSGHLKHWIESIF